MAITNLTAEVTSCPGVPDGLPTVEAIVGDTVSLMPYFVVPASGAAPVITLVRRPATSTAAVSGGSLTFDVAGYYYLTIANCGLSRSLTMVAFGTAAIGTQGATRASIRRLLLTNTMITPATMTAALETAPVVQGGLNALLFGQPIGASTFVLPLVP